MFGAAIACARGASGAALLGARRMLHSQIPPPDRFNRLVRFVDEKGYERTGEAIAGSSDADDVRQARDYRDGMVYDIAKFLPPVDAPALILVGLNYTDHAAEVSLQLPQLPVIFGKAASSITGHKGEIVIPPVASEKPEVDYEGELAVIIGRPCKDVKASEALNYVAGYACANDVSARRWQGKKGGGQWYRCKSFDTFGPLGPFLVSTAVVPDPNRLAIRTTVNGEVRQDSNTNQMIFSVPQIIEFCSQGTTLAPGTVICTGTPAGVGFARNPPLFLSNGDEVTVTIEGLGSLTNAVRVA